MHENNSTLSILRHWSLFPSERGWNDTAALQAPVDWTKLDTPLLPSVLVKKLKDFLHFFIWNRLRWETKAQQRTKHRRWPHGLSYPCGTTRVGGIGSSACPTPAVRMASAIQRPIRKANTHRRLISPMPT